MLELPEWETEESEDESGDEIVQGQHMRQVEVKVRHPGGTPDRIRKNYNIQKARHKAMQCAGMHWKETVKKQGGERASRLRPLHCAAKAGWPG